MEKVSLKFLIPAQFMNYDLLKPPSFANTGSGVGVKYARIEEAGSPYYNCESVSDTSAVEMGDIVFADWLWFCATQGKGIIDQVKDFIVMQNPKCIYGSECCVVTWPQQLIRQLVQNVNIITHNTEYQKSLYQTINIYNSRFLCDPVPEEIFSPHPRKKRRLVAVGQISRAKRSEAVLEIFTSLKDTGVERCYVGGSLVWAR